MAITKQDIITRVSEHDTFQTKKAAAEAVQMVIDTITEALVDGQDVNLGNSCGTFKVVERAARNGVNPSTGEKIQIAASKSAKFKPSAALKAALNG